ncbi:MAG TPA: isoprenylcysteine carboxylmethyltransferase family protein, partial [Elusimicrobia bacterium]|nr:isoprenylcysteine carboxylmethyltransferase family protein [Elusimicrobiota bacterium]
GYLFALVYVLLVRPTSLFLLVVGIEIAFFGLLIRFWAAGYLRKSEELCISGPYAYVRHPLYLGSFLLGFGFCLAGSSVKYWARSSI